MRMKLLFISLGLLISSTTVMADCTLPCGVKELLDCAALRQHDPLKSGQELYNQVLFQAGDTTTPLMLDGFCQLPYADLPAGSFKYPLQVYYYSPDQGNYCANSDPANPYYSYTAFVNAANAMATKAGVDGALACTGTVKDRYLELTAMLATFAQETTGGAVTVSTGQCTPPCTGGMYWRYENAWLQGDDLSFPTTYYSAPGKDGYFVGTSQAAGTDINTQQTFTPDTWYAGSGDPSEMYAAIYQNSMTPLSIGSTGSSSITESITATAPAGNNLTTHLTDPSVLYPGLWVGDGPTQLTAESMFYFYGWYQNVFLNGTQTANYYTFVNQYLRDGKVSFIGAYWYWMYRVKGRNSWTIHQMMTNNNPTQQVCHGIGAATALVNGGCNNFSGRKSFYDYFAGILNPDPGGPNDIAVPYEYMDMSSTDCTDRLATYCQAAT